MLSKRLIVCLDVKNRRVTKGVKFRENVEIGDPVEMAAAYYADDVDELVFYDISASSEGRPIDIGMVEEVARKVFVPFCVGGGIGCVEDMRRVLLAGADKVSVNSIAVRTPEIIADGAKAFGSQCIVVGMDVRRSVCSKFPSGYEVVTNGGLLPSGLDMLDWARKVEGLGAGEICLNSIDADGTKCGYDIEATRCVSDAVCIPVIASGGAGLTQHLARVLVDGNADAVLVASMVHFMGYTCSGIKEDLSRCGVCVRRT
jgi:cyclase